MFTRGMLTTLPVWSKANFARVSEGLARRALGAAETPKICCDVSRLKRRRRCSPHPCLDIRKCPFVVRHLEKLGIHFALVSPTFGFRGCDDRRLGPCRGPARAAPPAGAVGRKAGHEPANGGD